MNRILKHISLMLLLLGLTACSQLQLIKSEPSVPAEVNTTSTTPTTDADLKSTLDREIKSLFSQPYIDPLTRYLAQNKDDKRRAKVLPIVLKERERRCQKIAKRYESRDKTKGNLNRLRQSYKLSCPNIVANFAQQVEAATDSQASQTAEIENAESDEISIEEPVELASEVEFAPEIEQAVSTQPVATTVEASANTTPNVDSQSDKSAAKANDTTLTQAVTDCQVLFKIRNYAEAKIVCLPPAQQGSAIAQYNLGEIAVLSNDYKQAMKWMQQAANQGYAPAQFSLGNWFFAQKNSGQSNAQAIGWLKKAAAQDHLAALMLLGKLYYEGRGVTRDYQQALKWFRQAAQQHEDANMQATLGELYYQGQGTARNYSEALKWFKRAAMQGNASAQQRLGVLYEQGLGVTASTRDAYIWYSLAASQGDKNSTQARERLAQKLSEPELDQALQQAKSIAVQYQRL